MSEPLRIVLALLLAYLVGSIPFGLLIGFARGVDLRAHGSGNIGATNAIRVLGKKLGALCFALDVLKGLLPTLLLGVWLGVAGKTLPSVGAAFTHLGLAACAMLGHIFPVWLKFKGGKGVATGFGAMLGVWPQMTLPALGALAVWITAAAATRYVSLSSILAGLCLPLFVLLGAAVAGARRNDLAIPDAVLGAWPYWSVALLLAALVIVRHRANIARLRAGTEPKIGARKNAPSAGR
ncbi:MAG: glycerol-3-phosphate 1-O-acyltransferase PlsY [Phycisphaerales bacterium]